MNIIPPAGRLALHGQTERQIEHIRTLKHHDQTIVIGPAGTGKTYVSVAYGAEQLLAGKVEKIIVTRPAVPAGERHGFLPGRLEQKLAPWARPVIEVLNERLGKANVVKLMKEGQIRVETFEHLRGLTFQKAYMILDEAQNTTVSQIQMFLTRIGENSRVVLSGDVRQCDLLNGDSGLAYVVDLVKERNLPVPIIEYQVEDIVRDGRVKMWIEAFYDQKR